MSDLLNSLGLTEEAAPQVDWDAPESGKMPPKVFPGDYTLLFSMPEDTATWFSKVERNVNPDKKGAKVMKPFIEMTFQPIVQLNAEGQPIADEDTGEPLKLGPQRVNTFMSTKMTINRFAELLRA